jgi:hypothetical protein
VAATLFTVAKGRDLKIDQISPGDCPFIRFSDEYPRDGEVTTISADFSLTGVESENYDILSVQFYVGNPAFGGIPIGDPVAPVLEVHDFNDTASGRAQVLWDTTGFEGDRSIYVVLDPLNDLEE